MKWQEFLIIKTSLFLYEDNMRSVNYIQILKETLEEIKSKLNSDEVMLQMDNARYYRLLKPLSFTVKMKLKLFICILIYQISIQLKTFGLS